MDHLDEEILSELRQNAKASLKAAARKLKMPMSTLHNRIQRLEKMGVIRRYCAEIDWKKLGFGLSAYVQIFVDTTKLKELHRTQHDILSQVRALPFVESADIVTGDADMLAKVRAHDTQELGRLLTRDLQDIAGIVETKTLVCLE